MVGRETGGSSGHLRTDLLLAPTSALARPDLLAAPTAALLDTWSQAGRGDEIEVAEIDPELSDTAAFCVHYGVDPAETANCVVVAGRRGGVTMLAACVVFAVSRADVNGLVRPHLDARKVSFVPMDTAVTETGMEYGGITPVGLPAEWPILIDRAVAEHPRVVVGSGVRISKLWLPGRVLAALPGARVLDGLGT
ncbi:MULTISPECIES: YbaK/EbsC family protein [unclassified Frankia]